MNTLLDHARSMLNIVRKLGEGFLEAKDEFCLAVLGMSELVLYKALEEGKPLRTEEVFELDIWSLLLVLASDARLASSAGILPRLQVTPREDLYFARSRYTEWARSTLDPATDATSHAQSAKDLKKRRWTIACIWMYFVANGSAEPDLDHDLRAWKRMLEKRHYPGGKTLSDGDALDFLFWIWKQRSKRTDMLFVSRDHRLRFGKRQIAEAFDRLAGSGGERSSAHEDDLHLEDPVAGSKELTLGDTLEDPRALSPDHLIALRELHDLRNREEFPRLVRPILDALRFDDLQQLIEVVAYLRTLADLLRDTQDPAMAAALVCEGLGVDGRGGGSPTRGEVAEHYGISERQMTYRVGSARQLLPRHVA